MSGKHNKEKDNWRYLNDPVYRAGKIKSNKVSYMKRAIRFHLKRVKHYEDELVRLMQ